MAYAQINGTSCSPCNRVQVQMPGYRTLRRVFSHVPQQQIVDALVGATQLPVTQRTIVAARTLIVQQPLRHTATASAHPQSARLLLRTTTERPPMVRTTKAEPTTQSVVTSAPITVITWDACPELTDGPVPGLTAWLRSLALAKHTEAAARWAETQGACSLDEVFENMDEFTAALGLESTESKRMKTTHAQGGTLEIAASRPALIKAMSVPVGPLVKTTSVRPPVAVQSSSHVFGLSERTSTMESTRTSSDFDVWDQHDRAEMSTHCTSDSHLMRSLSIETPTIQRPKKDKWLWNKRADPLDVHLLRNKVITRDQAQRMAEESLVMSSSNDEQVTSKNPVDAMQCYELNTFPAMQQAFLNKHGDQILRELGPGVQLVPAILSTGVQHDFLSTVQKAGTVPSFGYHGTPEKNYKSIFNQGLRVPGNGGVSVANGSAHGIGIYTARPGAAFLSKGFRGDTSDLLVVGVVDNLYAAKPKYVNQSDQRKPAPRPTSGGDCTAVRCVRDARVIFEERRVAPLFIAHEGAEPKQQKQETPASAFVKAGRRQIVAKETGDRFWLPQHDLRCRCGYCFGVGQRLVAKDRDLKRGRARVAKASALGTF